MSSKRREQVKADRPKGQWGTLWFMLVVLTALTVGAYFWLRPKPDTYSLKTYTVAQVSRATILETASASGKVVPEKVLNFPAPGTGKLLEVNVSAGDEVKAGQIMARLESNDLRSQLRDAQNAVSMARDGLKQAEIRNGSELLDKQADAKVKQVRVEQLERDLKTARELFALGATAKVDVEKLQNDLLSARNEQRKAVSALQDTASLQKLNLETLERGIKDSQDRLEVVKQNTAKSVIVAPVDGRVLEVKAAQGDDVSVGTVLITLADTRKMRIDADVDEASAAQIKVGQPVKLLIGENSYQAEVSQVAPQAVEGKNGSSVPIKVQFIGAIPKLRPNVSAALEITVGVKKDVLSLPRAPFLTTGAERLVYVISDPNTAERREATFGSSSAERVEVVSGLALGEKIITSSMEAYKDKPKIEVSPTGALKDGQEMKNE
jgi:HlyD family secretion protein